MSNITDNLYQVRRQLCAAAAKAGRDPAEIKLLCVSKTKPSAMIREAYQAGERLFGESYISEAVPKIAALKAEGLSDIKWHFIGPIQSNKTRLIAENFDLVESVDRAKIIKRLNEQRPENLPPLEILIEVNLSSETQKSGCPITEIQILIEECQKASRLKLRGLMGVATETDDIALIHREFAGLKDLFERHADLPDFDILSMGMTHDLEEAILCGSTEIRIGTAIFGARDYSKK